MEVWFHDGKRYQVDSYYSLPHDAWHYELSGLTGAPGTGPHITVVVPDATPDDGPFMPKDATHALVAVAGGVTPWPILRRLLDLAKSSSDMRDEQSASPPGGEELSSNNVWSHDVTRFEVNSFYFGEQDAWCYELYEVIPDPHRNDYVEVQIPDAQPASGPFVPRPAHYATFTAHGTWNIPWPVFNRFIEAIQASGDIVEDQPAGGPTINV
jgi:hypothetical protein